MRASPIALSHVLHWTRRRLSIHYPRLLGRWLLARRHPEVVLVELTNACNQSCPFCAREVMTRPVGHMPFELFTGIVDQAAALPYVLLRVVGLGEAALHPRFAECIRYATARGVPMEITSNGEIFEVLSPAEIIASSIVMLSISIDGFGDGSYEKLRPGGDYRRLRSRIRQFRDARAAAGARRPLFTLRNVLMGKQPARRAEQAARFTAEWSALCDRISFNDYTPQRIAARNAGPLRACDDIFHNLHVEWDGRTPLCSYQHLITAQEYTATLGPATLAEAWNDPRRRAVRRAHVTGDLAAAPFCASCPKTRQAAVYRNVRAHGHHASRLRQAAERLLWRIVS